MSTKKRVYLGIPHSGRVIPGTLRTVMEATRRPDIRFLLDDRGGSLLNRNFNALWCRALNERRRHGGVDYFVMLHSDIQAEAGWLDRLLEEYERAAVDVLSVVVPIKDMRGLTTTGVAPPGCTKVKRFTLAEVAEFPTTFTAADAGFPEHRLMINTGLWICDFRRPWIDRHWPVEPPPADVGEGGRQCPAFASLDWIRQDADGTYAEQCLSEDWLWSHWCGDHGVKLAATTAVNVLHCGERYFGTRRKDWGAWETDLGDADPGSKEAA